MTKASLHEMVVMNHDLWIFMEMAKIMCPKSLSFFFSKQKCIKKKNPSPLKMPLLPLVLLHKAHLQQK